MKSPVRQSESGFLFLSIPEFHDGGSLAGNDSAIA